MTSIEFLDNELWYGGVVIEADKYPLSKDDYYEFDTDINMSSNQFNPIFLSNKGRFIWAENCGFIRFNKGVIELDKDDVSVEIGGSSLKDAALCAANKYYPADGTPIDLRAIRLPQYCSWVMFLWYQNQESILKYARSIVEKGYKPGLFIIDDTWQKAYGVWEFDHDRFPDPDAMMKELSDLGFLVSMWMCPYVSMDVPKISAEYPGVFKHIEADRLIMDAPYVPRMVRWWEGYSAQLDFKNQSAISWFNDRIKSLEQRYGIAGVKLDGGNPAYLGKEYKDASLQSTLFVDIVNNPLKEGRTCYKCAGKPIIQRLNDKAHLWKNKTVAPDETYLGLESLLPGIMTQGLVGYYYGCPDMIGGGESKDFVDKSNLDKELIIRWCQASILMPMIQFSYDVWNHEEERVAECCKKAMALRESLLPYIEKLAVDASKTNQPIVRFMEYEFPSEEFTGMKDQFMLGDKYLVAPVLEKGATEREVVFPEGKWIDIDDGKVYKKGKHKVYAPIDKLPVFEREV